MATPVARQLPAFKLGRKQVFLPTHRVTLVRKEFLPPSEAFFKVPLRFTKFDLRDYLWNLYNVEVIKVRSFVKGVPLSRKSPKSSALYRPQSQKFMVVSLVKPFQWPKVPEDSKPWLKGLWQRREDERTLQEDKLKDKARGKVRLVSQKEPSEERQGLAKLAKKLLSGQVKWSNKRKLDPKWDKVVTNTASPQESSANKMKTVQLSSQSAPSTE
ncbi:hypothetical protein CDD82_7185 [Ophiocordyceps australis]|uniref:Large ribosomal subunit protein uL23m n=1 Tax=Ophiocordyceps australis TaxID=1399860 RepID=A0A2C5YTW5_9HYPO|nr:hypothetical protein CDD82_7185 [Ophiocordyceps australis]